MRRFIEILIGCLALASTYAKSIENYDKIEQLLWKNFSTEKTTKEEICFDGEVNLLTKDSSKGALSLCLNPEKEHIHFTFKGSGTSDNFEAVMNSKEIKLINKAPLSKLDLFPQSLGAILLDFILNLARKDISQTKKFLNLHNTEISYREGYHHLSLIPKKRNSRLKFIKMTFDPDESLQVLAVQITESLEQYLFYIHKRYTQKL